MLETVLITLLAVLIATIKNRVFTGFSVNFYPVTYHVSYLVRLLVSSMLDQFVNARKVAYLRGLSDIVTLLMCLLFALLICNKKSPVIRRGYITPLPDTLYVLSCSYPERKSKVFRFPEGLH